jgi:hypothetical protein
MICGWFRRVSPSHVLAGSLLPEGSAGRFCRNYERGLWERNFLKPRFIRDRCQY